PTNNGGSAITGYTVTSSPGGLTASGAGSPLTVAGLTNGTAYTFSVTATNSAGTGSSSSASNSVTPIGSQTITFSNPGAQNIGSNPTLTASVSSGLTPSFTSSTIGVCTISSGGALSFVTTGSCTINVEQAGNAAYSAATKVSQTFDVNAVVAGGPIIGSATAGDTQASVMFSAPINNGGSAITGYTVTSSPGGLTASGAGSPLTVAGLTNGTAYTFSVTATNSAGTSGSSSASNSVTPIGSQTITFSNPGAQNIGSNPTLTASVSSGLTPSFTSSTIGVCTISSGGALSFVTTGSCTINVEQAGNAAYSAATKVSQTFDVNAVVAGGPIIGSATAGDTQASVMFSAPINNGGSAITGYTVTSSPGGLTASGAGSPLTVAGLTNGTAYTFSVTATNSAGTSGSSSASNSVTPIGSQTITFSNPGAQNIGTSPTLTASVSSGLTPSFTSSTIGVCTISSGGALSFVTTGSCTINVEQAGNAAYSAATKVSQTFDVNAVVAGGPIIGSATAGDTQASVMFSAPINNGGSAITGYTVTSSPGGLTASGAGSPLTVAGLTNGTAYTFSVTATNSAGISGSSSASNSVTPSGAPVFTSTPLQSVNQNETYNYTPIASDTAEDVLTYSALTLPSWLSFDDTTTSLTGVPSRDDVGSHSISLKVVDARGLSDIQSFTLVVNAVNSTPVADNANVILDEDTSLSIIFTATDDDGDVLTYEVVTQPSSGTFDKHGSAWLYTPNADFNGDDSVIFIAKDAESSSEPAVVSINVNPLNDEPMAVDDSYSQSLSMDSRYTMAVLDNDTDVDGDILMIDGAAADVGSVQVVASQLKYQAPTDFVGPVTLRYTISDGQKGRSNAKVQLLITGEGSADAPVITVPEDITANATGLFTKLKLGVAKAVDKAGNKLAVSLVNTQQLFAPGEHLAYWQATDSQGLSSIKSQKVTVNPLISISRNQVVAEGSEVQFSVYLNGTSDQYPVSIPYTVSGSSDANDHDLVDGVFEITSGLSASFSVNVFDDGITEADEELVISLDPSLNLSGQHETRLLITEANIAPQASILVTQSNELRSQVSKQEGKVYLKARTRDANVQDNLSEVWSTGTLLLESDEQGSYFDPSELDEGNYPISVVVTDDGIPELSTTVQLTLLIKAALPILTGDDSDGDLIPDDQEGFTDTDSDGIADYLDAINECNVLQEKSLEPSNFLAESQSGVCLRLGNTARLNGSDGIEIQEDDLIDDLQADNLGGLFDFELTDLPKQGDSVRVVIPQTLPVPTNAVYRKFVRGSWQDFVSNANNEVMSSAGNSGYCPPPGAAEWQAGLTEGHWCVQLTIEDGGPNDDDGIANGTIVDPGGVAVMLNGNALPLAVADAVTVPVNQGIEIDVLANDSDTDGDTLTVKQVISQFGTAEVLDNQQISYLPAEDFIGTDVLVYSISDGKGGTGSSKLSVTVVANRAPIAVDDMASTDDKTTLILDVLSNDTDADNQTLSVIAVSAQQGSVMIENNKIRYTPITGFEGVDTVSYTISDGEGGEATANVMVTVKAYQAQVVENESSGGSMHWLWSGLLLLVIMLRLKPESCFKYYKVLSLGLVVLLASSSHVQAQGSSSVSPWYLDAVVGFSESVNTQAELQREIPTGQIEAFDKSDTSFGFSIGYQVNSVLAFELGYIDFGEGSTQISGESLNTDQYHELFKSVSPILPTGFNVGVDLSLVEHDGWRFSVPVGVLVWESEVKSYSQGQTLTTKFDGTDWYTGMHLDYQFTRNWSAGLGIDYIALAPNDILSYQLNLRYQF
ncbi:Ig-like domain-containing protein, partial [Shewanella frigidimarina]|uniref:Ig-like domain-containing protein n=1 Tax=Shewanella frigidimarina TaxID=56812 RepID=UPI003D7BC093